MSAAVAWTEQDRADFIAAARAAISGPRAEDAARPRRWHGRRLGGGILGTG